MFIEQSVLEDLIQSYANYIKALGDELNETASIARVHGWKSSRYEQGVILRDRITSLKEQIKFPNEKH